LVAGLRNLIESHSGISSGKPAEHGIQPCRGRTQKIDPVDIPEARKPSFRNDASYCRPISFRSDVSSADLVPAYLLFPCLSAFGGASAHLAAPHRHLATPRREAL
jgi:hypothetical protein